MKKRFRKWTSLLCLLCVLVSVTACGQQLPADVNENTTESVISATEWILTESVDDAGNKATTQNHTASSSTKGDGADQAVNPSSISAYSGSAYIVLNHNQPNFSAAECVTQGYETYSPLDRLGRCGVAFAVCGKEIMPADGEKRGNISEVKPSGWIQAKYNGISGGYLWNRCHLIGWQLSAENANPQNLITGTRYMNVEGMLPFENMVADYIRETGNHVAYRVTPIFEGNHLVCSGVEMEAYSVEDDGEGICFHVYCYNVQPNIKIDYATGSSAAVGGSAAAAAPHPKRNGQP